MNNQPLGFGAIERTPNLEDFPLGTVSPANNTRPPVFIQDLSPLPVEMQNQEPACGSHAGSFLKNIQETKELGTPQRKSPEYLWKKIKLIDGYPPESGTDMLSIMKTLKSVGVCDYSLLGNDSTLPVAQYTDPSVITAAMDINAQNAKIGAYAFQFNPTMEQIKQAIYDFGAVLVLMQIGSEFWTPSWKEADILPLRTPASPVGGHFVLAHSYDEQYVYFRNEWSSAWGRNGDGYFGENYIPFIKEIGTAFDVPDLLNTDFGYSSAGIDVMRIQRYLVSHGFGTYIPTGFFGSQTLVSVQNFQKTYGIPATGYVGPLTRTKLNLLMV